MLCVACWNGLQDLTNCDLYNRSYLPRTCPDNRPASTDTEISRQGLDGRVTVGGYGMLDGI